MKRQTINARFGEKHRQYIARAIQSTISVAEGAVRSGKTIDNITAFAWMIERGAPDRIHLATGSTAANAKMNIGDANGFGLEHIFRGRCRWGKYRGNEALFITAHRREYVVIFAGAAKSDSYKKIRGNSYGMWIATEINLHHQTAIQEAFNRQLAAKCRRVFWDLNPSAPGHWIYRDYIDRFSEQFPATYNYQKFQISDNETITPVRLDEIKRQYIPGTVWYRRDILGERTAVEGVIYEAFANDASAFFMANPQNIVRAVIGVDFGGGKSAHAFCCVGFTHGMREVIVLDDWRCKKTLDPERLQHEFNAFVRRCQLNYRVTDAYCDSAEQTLIAGLRTAAARERIPINIWNARKRPIIDRIRATCLLMGQGRFFVSPKCENTIDALQSALWDSRHETEDVRLDNGTTNIDSLDAMEYAFENDIKNLIRSGIKWSA